MSNSILYKIQSKCRKRSRQIPINDSEKANSCVKVKEYQKAQHYICRNVIMPLRTGGLV